MANTQSFLLKFGGDASGLAAAAGKAASAVQAFTSKVNAASSQLNKVGNNVKGAFNTINTGGASRQIDLLSQRINNAELQAQQLRDKLAALKNATPADNTTKILALKKALEATEKKAAELRSKLSRMPGSMKASPEGQALQRQIAETEAKALRLKVALEKAQMPADNTEEVRKLEMQVTKAEDKVLRLKSAFDKLTTSASKPVSASVPGASGDIGKSVDGFKKVSVAINNISKQFLNFNDLVRMTALGLVNFGRTLMYAVSIPAVAFFGGLVKGAIDFEAAMVRVSKTTGIMNDALVNGKGALDYLGDGLRQIAVNSPTAISSLAGIAETLGQLGVTSPDAILKLTQMFDMMSITFGQAAEEIASNMGKIAAAFGFDLNSSTEEIWRLANVINMLENTTAAAAGEIQTAVLSFAPLAATLNISMAEAAALSATLISLGYSADEAGTALKRLSEFSVKEAESLQAAMKNFSGTYATLESTLAALSDDPVQVFADLAAAIDQATASGSDSAVVLGEMMEMLGKIGGPAILALASNYEMLRNNISASNTEWAESVSIIAEYERAMQSTQAQIGLFKNNVSDLGIVLGDAIMPVINDIIQVAVPAIRMLAAWFKNLSQSTKMQIVAFAALAIVAGPVMMLLGQLIYPIALIATGLNKVIFIIAYLIANLGKLAGALSIVGKVFLSWPGFVVAASVLVLKGLQKMGVDIAGFFKRLAKAAETWGKNLAAEIANGLIAGAVSYIAKAISYIANLIASFFEAHSPPKQGPLSTIDRWGAALMQTFLDGFSAADFGILEDIASTIEQILTSGKKEMGLVKALQKLAKDRVKLAELIEKFNQTGIIDEDLLDEATEGLGDMQDEVKELIRLSLRYEAIQEKLAALEAKRKDVLKQYDAEIGAIGASNMSIEDKVEAIRAAKRARDDSLDGIDKEEELLEQQAELLKQQLDYQQAMIDTLMKQKDIFQQIADILEGMKEDEPETPDMPGGGGAGGGGGGFELPSLDVDNTLGGIAEEIGDITGQFDGLIDRFEKGKGALQGFIDAWNGVEYKLPYDKEISDLYTTMYNLGAAAASVRDRFNELRTKVEEFISGAQSIPTKISEGIAQTSPVVAGLGTVFSVVGGVISYVFDKMKSGFDVAKSIADNAYEVFNKNTGVADNLKVAWNSLVSAFNNLKNAVEPMLPVLKTVAQILGGAIVGAVILVLGVITSFISGLSAVLPFVINVFSGIVTAVSGAVNTVIGLIQMFAGLFTGNLERARQGAATIIQGLVQLFVGMWTGIKNLFVGGITWITASVSAFIETVAGFFTDLYNRLVGNSIVPDMMNGIKEVISGGLTDVVTSITTFVTNAVTEFVKLATAVKEKASEFYNAGADLITGIINGIFSKASELATKISEVANNVLNTIKSVFGIASPSTVLFEIGVNLLQGLINGIQSLVGTIGSVLGGIAALIVSKISESLSNTGELDSFTNSISKKFEEIQDVVERIVKKLVQKWKEFTSEIGDTKAIDNIERSFEYSGKKAKELETSLDKVSGTFTKLTGDADKAGKGIKTYDSSVNSTISTMNRFSSYGQAAFSAVERKISSIISGFRNTKSAIDTTTSSASRFSSVANSISISRISSMSSAWLSVKNAITTAYASLTTFIGKLSALNNTQVKISLIATGSSANWSGQGNQDADSWTGDGTITPKASGGSIVPGNPYVVGELGEELFIPRQSGSILPNYLFNKLLNLGAGGGETQVVTININNPVVRDDTDIQKLAQAVSRELAKNMRKQSGFSGVTY